MLNVSEITIRVIPMGVSGIDPATDRPWGSYEKAIEAFERSRAIAATCQPIKVKCPRAKPKGKSGSKPGPRPMPWAEETRRLAAAGMTVSALAAHFGITPCNMSKRCKRLGLKFRSGRPYPRSVGWEEETRRLWEAGMTQSAMAAHFGISSGAMCKRCKKLGLTFPVGRRPKAQS